MILISEVEIPCQSVSKTHDFGASRISTIWSVHIRQRTQLTGFSLSVETPPGLNEVDDRINNFRPASQETVKQNASFFFVLHNALQPMPCAPLGMM